MVNHPFLNLTCTFVYRHANYTLSTMTSLVLPFFSVFSFFSVFFPFFQFFCCYLSHSKSFFVSQLFSALFITSGSKVKVNLQRKRTPHNCRSSARSCNCLTQMKFTVKFSNDHIKPWKPDPFTSSSLNWQIQSFSALLCINVSADSDDCSISASVSSTLFTLRAYNDSRCTSTERTIFARCCFFRSLGEASTHFFWTRVCPVGVGAWSLASDPPQTSNAVSPRLPIATSNLQNRHQGKPSFTRWNQGNPIHNDTTPFVK